MHRRDLLINGAMAGVILGSERAFGQAAGRTIIPWADQPAAVPPPLESVARGLTPWENLDSWITPNDKFFSIAHYNRPQIDAATWRLDVSGQIGKPLSFSLDQLKALPRHEVTFTLECSGDNGLPFLQSAIGNARWAGASLSDVLKAAEIKNPAVDVVFYGSDQGEEVVRPGTPLEYKYSANFARSMSVADAMNPANLLCYEMNGAALPAANGFPLRLIAPGWFGIANVKWLTRVEVRSDHFVNRFMGRDYITIREEHHNGKTAMVETTVGRLLLKSAPARVVRLDGRYEVEGMSWGPRPVALVEVKIDDGPWLRAKLAESKSAWSWRSWSLDWHPGSGDHTITARATDIAGNVQPAMDDPVIANKKTYWESNGQITRHVHIA
jgi:DMSO/TMAO reductase YedYZ molybdopterin-dependent catalytic subunit